jgi:hypothetical protein
LSRRREHVSNRDSHCAMLNCAIVFLPTEPWFHLSAGPTTLTNRSR